MQHPTLRAWPIMALVAALTAVIGYQSYALGMAAAEPTAVATVDLERVFDGLKSRDAADAQLTGLAEELRKEGDDLAHAIDLLNEEIDALAVGSDAYETALERLQLATLQYQAFVEFSRRKIDVEKALTLRRLYADIRAAARTLGEEQGWDVILVNDATGDLVPGTEADVRRQISVRRVLFAGDGVDLSDVLIARMNNG